MQNFIWLECRHILNGNAIWYLTVATISILLLIYTLWKKKGLKIWALFFCLCAFASFFEDVIFVWLGSYEYYPHLIKNPYYDMILGAYLSQILYVPAFALFYAAFNLKFRWSLIFTTMFVGIEFLFIRLGIYKLNWWNQWYTFIGILIYFGVAKKWHIYLYQTFTRFIRFITLFCIAYIIGMNLAAIPSFCDHYHFAVGWFDDFSRNNVVVVIIYMIARAGFVAFATFYRLYWLLQSLVPILMMLSYLVLINLHIFTFKYSWDLYFLPMVDILDLICCNYFNRGLLKSED